MSLNYTTAKPIKPRVADSKSAEQLTLLCELLDHLDTILNQAGSGITGAITLPTATIADDAVTTAKIVDDAVTTPKIVDDAVTTAKIVDDAVTTAKIPDDAITTAKILDDNVTTAKIPDDAVTTAKIPDDAITTAKILDDNVTTAKIPDDAVTTAKIPDDAITTAKILDDNVTTAKIPDDAITTAKIVDDAVATAKIPDDAVTTAKIPDDAITTAKIADDQVTTAKIPDDNITDGKLAAALHEGHASTFLGAMRLRSLITGIVPAQGAVIMTDRSTRPDLLVAANDIGVDGLFDIAAGTGVLPDGTMVYMAAAADEDVVAMAGWDAPADTKYRAGWVLLLSDGTLKINMDDTDRADSATAWANIPAVSEGAGTFVVLSTFTVLFTDPAYTIEEVADCRVAANRERRVQEFGDGDFADTGDNVELDVAGMQPTNSDQLALYLDGVLAEREAYSGAEVTSTKYQVLIDPEAGGCFILMQDGDLALYARYTVVDEY